MIYAIRRTHFYLLLTALGGMFLQSCAKYEPKPFNRPLGVSIKKKELTLAAHQLSSSESKYYFNSDITNNDFQVIHLSVTNHSEDPYVLDAHWIDLHLAPISKINGKIHYNTPLYMTPWLVASLSWWPLLGGAAIAGYNCSSVNKEITNDLEARAFCNNSVEVIRPKNRINKFLFVSRENWRHSFTTILVNKKTNERVPFDIVL